MADGSVIVDLAVERGGNVEGAVPGEVAKVGGVTIIGHLNMAGRIPASASALLARNIYAFVEPMIDKETKALPIKRDDEIVAATLSDRGRGDRASGLRAEGRAGPAGEEQG